MGDFNNRDDGPGFGQGINSWPQGPITENVNPRPTQLGGIVDTLASRISNTPVVIGQLRSLIKRFGIEVNWYVNTATDYDETYGVYSGVNIEGFTEPVVIKLLMPINPWTVVDNLFTTGFDSIYIYTMDNISNGDLIEMIRQDSTIMRFKVVELVALGLEKKIVSKFRMAPLGE